MIIFCSLCSRWKNRFASYNGDMICRGCCRYVEICRMSTYGRIDLNVEMYEDNGIKFKLTSKTGNLEFYSSMYTKYTKLISSGVGHQLKYRIVFLDFYEYIWVGFVSHSKLPYTVTFRHSIERFSRLGTNKRTIGRHRKFRKGDKKAFIYPDGTYRMVTILKFKPELRGYLAETEDGSVIRVLTKRLRSENYARSRNKEKITSRDTRQ